jgi:hypothetical protein
MKDVMDKNSTAPGKFSVLPRTAEFKGKLYHYPCYKIDQGNYVVVPCRWRKHIVNSSREWTKHI